MFFETFFLIFSISCKMRLQAFSKDNKIASSNKMHRLYFYYGVATNNAFIKHASSSSLITSYVPLIRQMLIMVWSKSSQADRMRPANTSCRSYFAVKMLIAQKLVSSLFFTNL